MHSRLDLRWLDTVAVSTVALVLYRLTAAPDVYYTDCGELAGVCATLGVAHPTGYPLFTLVGYLWHVLPLPLPLPIAKLNLLMTVLGASAVAVVHRTSLHLVGRVVTLDSAAVRVVAAIAALLFATARTIWAQALSLEVHALQVLLVVLLIHMLVRWENSRRRRQMVIAALVLGLCFTNHLSSIVLLPGVLVMALLLGRGSFAERVRELALPAVMVILCALLYVYLPLRSASGPIFDWGEVHRSFDKFWYHVSGKQYSVWMFSGGWRQQLAVFWKLLLPNTALPFSLWGLWILWRRNRPMALLLVLMAVVCVGYVINYSIHDIEPYFVSAFVALSLAAAVGIAALWRYRFVRGIVVLLPLAYTVWNWRVNDLHAHRLVRDYVRLVVEPLPKGSIVFSQQWDYFCSAFWYLQQVEGYRRDIVLVEKELLRRTWYVHQLERWYGEPIRRCSTEIAAYMPLLEEFESGRMPKERYNQIQRAFVALLRALAERNPDRYWFATPEVIETEPELASAFEVRPYGATVALVGAGGQIPPLPTMVEPQQLMEGVRRYDTERLDRGLAAVASLAYVRTGDAVVSHDRRRAAECYRAAIGLDRSNMAARDRLARLYNDR